MTPTELATAERRGPGVKSDAAAITAVPVERIRPEEGLGRKRDRAGHRELQNSIQQFGVLTPITVRPAADGSGDYLLIKGQGRTLACRLLGLDTIPAIVVDAHYSDDDKVQQFLVENVARLKMRPVDRALLIHRARQAGEETTKIAERFGLSSATVRRLLAQLSGASAGEVAALREGQLSLALHAVITRHVAPDEREAVTEMLADVSIPARELESLFIAIGWQDLVALGPASTSERLTILAWACDALGQLPAGTARERFAQLALLLPDTFESNSSVLAAAR